MSHLKYVGAVALRCVGVAIAMLSLYALLCAFMIGATWLTKLTGVVLKAMR